MNNPHCQCNDLRDLFIRLSSLCGNVLYIESDSWKGTREKPLTTNNSQSYWHLDRVEMTDCLRFVTEANERHTYGTRDFSLGDIVSWRWFQPGPEEVGTALEEYVQRRKMRPLEIVTCKGGTSWEINEIWIVPDSVLNRPRNPHSIMWCYGEPWCHKCNETFFWSKDVQEVLTIRHGSHGGLMCEKCHAVLPD